jgi:hypothetical protein
MPLCGNFAGTIDNHVKTSALTRPARWGATVSLVGYLSAVAAWLLLALSCGIQYFNPRCDAIVDPIIMIALGLGFASLPVGRTIGLVLRSTLTSAP